MKSERNLPGRSEQDELCNALRILYKTTVAANSYLGWQVYTLAGGGKLMPWSSPGTAIVIR